MQGLRFAHLTDPHLPLHSDDLDLGLLLRAPKRLTGALSWWRKRRHIHLPEVREQAIRDVAARGVEHLVITGDLVNIAAPGEFARAKFWLESLGSPDSVTVVPGNHDRYVAVSAGHGADLWSAWSVGDGEPAGGSDGAPSFPFLRVRRDVAFIGLSTAVETPVFVANGRLGEAQLQALDHMLDQCGSKGLCRVVLLHHPPGSAGASRRKGLTDREALLEVLKDRGAELILHGHTHRPVLDRVPGPAGPIPVMAPSSASAATARPALARWNEIEVTTDEQGHWVFDVTARLFDPATARFESAGRFRLKTE